MFTKLYRDILPISIRQTIYDNFLGRVIYFLRNSRIIIKSQVIRFFPIFASKNEENAALAFMGSHGITSYPYPYALEYSRKVIDVNHNAELNLPFVYHNDRKLYFPESYNKEKVIKAYKALLIEQDPRAAHRYVRDYAELKGKLLIDVGAAEASFALDTIDLTSAVIIFECMDYWQKPLEATFAPWTKKVTIVKKFIGNKTSAQFITIDDYLKTEQRDNLFIKMDIEGAERKAIEGSRNTLRYGKGIQLAVCTYHNPGDPEHIEATLTEMGYRTEFSEGLMYWNRRFSKGVIRAKK